ncbi:arsenic metallochaperone ArsD family protein [Lacrimispora sp. BS-2]|uniref:Arsenic metallochaperone ArsD family protein n=1 Tax=Lacrimispora sp. BS-2 TaxID=3151850 RepID=A0AAU7PSB5_9FIRM
MSQPAFVDSYPLQSSSSNLLRLEKPDFMASSNTKDIRQNIIIDKGPDSLPVAVMDGKIVLAGRYPINTEFTEWLDLPASLLGKPAEKAQGNDGCC